MKAWDMDATRFDMLARSLHDMRSRRAALAAFLGGTLAAVSVTSVAAAKATGKGDGPVKRQGSGGQKSKWRCRYAGKTCRRKSKELTKADCKFCCGESFTQLTAKKGRCCNHEGLPCATTEQCCLGVCTEGTCQGDVIYLPPPPTCIPYGGVCIQTTDCCSPTPCTNQVCRYP
jgi:hypothetical protein